MTSEIFCEEEINTVIEVNSPYKSVFESYIKSLMTLLLLKEAMPEFSDIIDFEIKKHAIALLDFGNHIMDVSEQNL